MHGTTSLQHRNRPRRGGFTLMEVALATIIIGVGMTALMELLAAGTMTNVTATHTTIAVNLARNVRELSLSRSFSDLTTLNAYTRPIDAMGNTLTDLTGWTQEVTVDNVQPTSPGELASSTTGMRSIRVTLRLNGNQVYQTSWLTCQSTP